MAVFGLPSLWASTLYIQETSRLLGGSLLRRASQWNSLFLLWIIRRLATHLARVHATRLSIRKEGRDGWRRCGSAWGHIQGLVRVRAAWEIGWCCMRMASQRAHLWFGWGSRRVKWWHSGASGGSPDPLLLFSFPLGPFQMRRGDLLIRINALPDAKICHHSGTEAFPSISSKASAHLALLSSLCCSGYQTSPRYLLSSFGHLPCPFRQPEDSLFSPVPLAFHRFRPPLLQLPS